MDKITLSKNLLSNQEAVGFIKAIGSEARKGLDMVDNCKAKLLVLKEAFKSFSRDDDEVNANLVFWDGLDAICHEIIRELMDVHEGLVDMDRTYLI
jgi:hypothetical protein